MKKTWILFLLILTLLLQGCMTKNPYTQQTATEAASDTPNAPQSTVSSPSDTQIKPGVDTQQRPITPEEPIYTYLSSWANTLEPYLATNDPYYLQIINKTTNEFGGTYYEPASLTKLDTRVTPEEKEIELDTRVAQAVYAMLAEMAHAGITDVMVTSGYRSYERQTELYNRYIKNEMSEFTDDAYACLGRAYIEANYDIEKDAGLNWQDAERVVLSYSAYPGTSEHQTALCVDFITSGMTQLTNVFEDTRAFEWLSQNAHRFGFILRYPKDKTNLTGYAYESWHYRYVGRDAATDIYLGNLTLEQYRETVN